MSASVHLRNKMKAKVMLGLVFLFNFNWTFANWVLHNNEIDQRVADRDQNFRMADVYKYTRKEMQKFYRHYLYCLAFAVISGVTCSSLLLHYDDLRPPEEIKRQDGLEFIGILNVIAIILF